MAQWQASEIERQRAEAQRRKLSSALEQTADSVVITNRDGVIEYVNSAFQQMTGYTREEISGKTAGILKSGKHGEQFYRQLWQTILQGETYNETIINRRKNGSLYYEEKTITPLKDASGGIAHFVATGKDMTKRRLAEERLRQQQTQLAHACRFSAMGEMSTALAHELNQPLTAIVNYAQGCLLRLHAGEVSRIDLLTALEHIAVQGKLSGEIIRRLRDFLRTGKSSLRTRSDINDIVREAAELAGLEARRKEITLRLELSNDLPPVSVDTIQIEQVLLNLVHNAIEAIDAAQWPRREVVIRTSRDPNNGVEVSVHDTGPGLPEGKGETIFEAFFTTKSGGMGMGLCISRSIIETHGDQLQAMPNPNGGAIFRFALPAVEGGVLQ
jgi:PAS domain S-box-containing protein